MEKVHAAQFKVGNYIGRLPEIKLRLSPGHGEIGTEFDSDMTDILAACI